MAHKSFFAMGKRVFASTKNLLRPQKGFFGAQKHNSGSKNGFLVHKKPCPGGKTVLEWLEWQLGLRRKNGHRNCVIH